MSKSFDTIIFGGRVYDGSGAPARPADVGMTSGKITAIGDLSAAQASERIDAAGKAVCPGFIDHHSHGDQNVFVDRLAGNQLLQGITTEVTGHCGSSMAPGLGEVPPCCIAVTEDATPSQNEAMAKASVDFAAWVNAVSKLDIGTNMGFYAGHGSIRWAVMGEGAQKPSAHQMDAMKAYVRDAMDAGFLGITSGLIYPPGCYADVAELSELCEVVASYGGVYCTHIRDEGDTVLKALEEACTVAQRSGVELVVSHHKVTGKHNWDRSEKTLALIDDFAAKGVTVHMDQYPYNAGATQLMHAIPRAYFQKGRAALIESLNDPAVRAAIRAEMLMPNKAGEENLLYSSGGPEGVLIGNAMEAPEAEGKNLMELAELYGRDPYDLLFDIVQKTDGSAIGVFTVVGEADIRRILKDPRTAIGTDGVHGTQKNLFGHPRLYGTFPTIFEKYVRKEKLLTLEDAIRKCTGLPASISHLKNKGFLREGLDADIVVFDPASIAAHADYSNPMGSNTGLDCVIVGGVSAVIDDMLTGAYNGQVVLHD